MGLLSEPAATKVCTKCRRRKAKSEYGVQPDGKDGLNAQCRVCVRLRYYRWCRANPELLRAKDARAYVRTKKKRKANPERHRAVSNRWVAKQLKADPKQYHEWAAEKTRAWRAANPGKAREISARAYAKAKRARAARLAAEKKAGRK